MENPTQSSNTPETPQVIPEGERILTNEEVLEDVQRMCEAILNPQARIFKARSYRMQKKVMRDFYDQNDVLPEHDASITKLLSLEILKKGFTGGEKSIIKKGFLLGKHYLERTGEFDPRYFQEILEGANICLNNIPEEDEEKISFIIDGLDFLFGRAQRIIDVKGKNVNERERKFYELAGDFHSHFRGDFTSASEYYEVGAILGDDSCHQRYCELMENAEDPLKAIPQIQEYWEKYKNIHYIEALIVLQFRAGNEKGALQAYNTYASLIPSPDPIFSFKRKLSLTDFAALDDSITLYHIEPGEHILDKQLEEQAHSVTMDALARNAKVLRHLNEDTSIQKEKGFDEEYQRLTTEQLLLFHRLIYGYLDYSVLGYYLHYLDELSKTDGGYDFLVDFFESHSVEHVGKLVEFFAQKQAAENGETYQREENSFADTFVDHMQFILQHVGTSRLAYNHTIEKIEGMLKRLGVTDEDILETLEAEIESYQYLQGTLESIPRELYQLLCKYQEIIYTRYGQMFLRKLEYIIQFGHGSIPHQNDIDVMVYTFMIGCLFKNEVAIDSGIEQLKQQAISDEDARVLGVFSTEYGIDDLGISMLTECCHPDDPDVLENICRLGIFNPERIMEIYTNFSHNLDELSYEGESLHLLSFLDEIEEEVRTHSRSDITIPRILKIQGLAHWMEAKNLENLSRGKDSEKDERAIFHRKKAERYFENALALIDKFLLESELRENTEALSFTEKEREGILLEQVKFLQDSGKELEAFILLQSNHPYTEKSSILVLLANLAMKANIRNEARKYITILDKNGRIEATELWVEYYFRGDAEERLKAIQTLGASSQEILDEINEELYEAVKTYTKERFKLLQRKKDILNEDEAQEFLHLLRYQSITFGTNLDLTILYWKELQKKIREGDFDSLNEFFLKYVHPEELAIIGNKIKEEDKAAHKALINVRQESHLIYNIFAEKEDTTELMHEIMETFRLFPNGIGLGFIQDWEIEKNAIEQGEIGVDEKEIAASWEKHDAYERSLEEAREQYGIVRVPTYANLTMQ